MNKELYTQIENLNIEIFKLSQITMELKRIIEKKDVFKRKESILALERIKNYYEEKNNEFQSKRKKLGELKSLCNHYIAIKSSHYRKFQCLFCKEYFFDIKEMKNESNNYLWIDTSEDLDADKKLKLFFNETINSDKDVIKEVSEYTSEIQYESKIKIYRRET